MTFKYRGISYQSSTLTVNTQKTELNATYRGQSYQLNSSVGISSKPFAQLTYRGIKFYNHSVVSNPTNKAQGLDPAFNWIDWGQEF